MVNYPLLALVGIVGLPNLDVGSNFFIIFK